MAYFSKASIYVLLIAFYVLTFAFPAFAGGLVPCGGPGQDTCTLCYLFVLINNVFRFLVMLSVPLATLLLAWGGFTFLTSGGDEGRRREGKQIITGAVVGFAIVLLSWLIVGGVINFIGGYIAGSPDPSQPPGFLWPWNQISCS